MLEASEKRQRVLVVEQSPRLRQLLVFLLESEGYDVQVCRTGAEALQHTADRIPDAILLEALLQDMQGLDLCQMLRHDGRFADTRIVFISALGREVDVARGLDSGADAYITKPFAGKYLLATLRRLLK